MDEYQTLLNAKELITRKQYQEARRLLQPIAHHPTARKWLDTLDKIAPPPPPDPFSFDDDPFAEAIPDPFASPSGFGFQSAPRQDSNPFRTGDHHGAYTFPSAPPPKDLSGIPPYSKPWNPQTFFVAILMFGWGALVMYSLNWRRFGRPKWAWPSFIIGVLLMAVPLGGLGIAGAAGLHPKADIAIFPIMTAFIGFYVYLMALYWYQTKEYKRYEIYGDVGGANKYKNDVYWIGGGLVVLVVGLLGAVMLVSTLATQPKEINTPYLTVEKPTGWTTEASYEASYCSDYPQGCFLFLHEIGSELKVIAFVYFPLEGMTPEARVTSLWQQYQTWYPSLRYGPQSQLLIDGQAVTFQEFVSPPIYSPDGAPVGNYYVARGYVPTSNGLIEITFWSSSEAEFHQYYPDFVDIFGTIDVKN